MFSLKLGRGPSIHRAIGGLVAGLFGVLWTVLAVGIAANAPFPYFGIVFPLFGVLLTLAAWGQAAYHFVNAARQQQFTEYDFVSQQDESDPPRPQAPGNSCPRCQSGLQATFRYCPQCGMKLV
jgi:hypothetical protein